MFKMDVHTYMARHALEVESSSDDQVEVNLILE